MFSRIILKQATASKWFKFYFLFSAAVYRTQNTELLNVKYFFLSDNNVHTKKTTTNAIDFSSQLNWSQNAHRNGLLLPNIFTLLDAFLFLFSLLSLSLFYFFYYTLFIKRWYASVYVFSFWHMKTHKPFFLHNTKPLLIELNFIFIKIQHLT